MPSSLPLLSALPLISLLLLLLRFCCPFFFFFLRFQVHSLPPISKRVAYIIFWAIVLATKVRGCLSLGWSCDGAATVFFCGEASAAGLEVASDLFEHRQVAWCPPILVWRLELGGAVEGQNINRNDISDKSMTGQIYVGVVKAIYAPIL